MLKVKTMFGCVCVCMHVQQRKCREKMELSKRSQSFRRSPARVREREREKTERLRALFSTEKIEFLNNATAHQANFGDQGGGKML